MLLMLMILFVDIWRFHDCQDSTSRHLEFYGSNNGFFEKETIAVNCLLFEKKSRFCVRILATV